MSRTETTKEGYIVITPKGTAHRILDEVNYGSDEQITGGLLRQWVGRNVEVRTICGLKMRPTWETFGRIGEDEDVNDYLGSSFKEWHNCR